MRFHRIDPRLEYGCVGKFKYTSKRLAKRSSRRKIHTVHAYFCDGCKFWHVGSNVK